MKKTFILLLMLLLSSMTFAQVSTWDGTWEPWTHGTGTESDPFLIENAQQLAYLTYRVNNGLDAAGGHVSNHDYHYKLMKDIDLNGSDDFQWAPIGYWSSDTDYQCFGGHFDGNNHNIFGLYINKTAQGIGLFSYISGATVKNLAVSGTKVSTSGANAGGIIGWAENPVVIDCCSNISDCISGFQNVGGIVGYVDGTAIITNCSSIGTVSVSNTTSVSGATNNAYSGGLVGYVNGSAVITNCHMTGSVSSAVENYTGSYGSGVNYSFSGGIVGYVKGTSTITNCYHDSGCVTASTYADTYSNSHSGGIIGHAEGDCSINNCYKAGDVMSSASGWDDLHVISRRAIGGGIIGCANNTVTITNSYYSGGEAIVYSLSPFSQYSYSCSYLGGIIGCANNTIEITNCYSICLLSATTGNNSSVDTGGLVGYCSSGSVVNSYYLNTCGGNNTYGGQPMSSDAMQSAEFVSILNAGSLTYKQDTQPYVNEGYPIFSGFSIDTQPATSVSYTSAILNGSYTSDCYNIISQGFEYKKTTEQHFTVVNCTAGQSRYAYDLRGLTHGTTYHYRAFVTADEGSAYGELVQFTTSTLPSYTITASSSNGGNINPIGNVTVYEGESKTFTITPASDYVIQSVLVDGESVGTPSSYTFENVNENHTISVSFRSLIHHITATVSDHGTISPNGDIIVQEGQNKTFTITPDPGFEIAALIVDNDTIEPVSTYIFSNVTSNHTIKASFTEMTGPCLPPLNLIVNVIDATSVQMIWQGGADVYVIAYGTNDTYNHAASTSDNSIVISDLLPQSSYVWKIKSICGDLETDYVEGQPFTTSGHGVNESGNIVFGMWPNPACETVTITGDSIEKIEVFNVLGQKVLTVCEHETTTILDVSDLNAGLYLIRVTDSTGNVGFGKLMVK